MDFVPPDLEFVPPGLDFVPKDLDIVPGDLEIHHRAGASALYQSSRGKLAKRAPPPRSLELGARLRSGAAGAGDQETTFRRPAHGAMRRICAATACLGSFSAMP